MNKSQINIHDLIDYAKFTPFHWKVLILCLIIIIFDGYDLVIYGVALPLLMQQWSLSAVQAGLLASAALFGMMFGAMIFGTLSDKLGRKKTILCGKESLFERPSSRAVLRGWRQSPARSQASKAASCFAPRKSSQG